MTDEQLDRVIKLISEAVASNTDTERVQKVANALKELTLERDRRKTSGRWEPTPTSELDEPILEDDYPMYGDYWYVVDGEPRRSNFHNVTVKEYKILARIKEVRRCDAVGRKLPLL